MSAQKAAYEQQLQAAQIHLLELQGARNAYDQWVAQKAAEEAAARAAAEKAARDAAAAAAAARANSGGSSGGGGGGGGGGGDYVQPAYGRVSSCFGARWGVTHFGVDIANSIGTPIYAATSGVVKRAGAATGFGLAVYILGDDGAVTVYGHVNRYFVDAGERVVGRRADRRDRQPRPVDRPAPALRGAHRRPALQQPDQPGAVAQRPRHLPRGLRRLNGPPATQLRPATSGMSGGPLPGDQSRAGGSAGRGRRLAGGR